MMKSSCSTKENVAEWNSEQTKNYLLQQGLDDFSVNLLCEEDKLDGKCLLVLNDADFTIDPINNLTLKNRKLLFLTCKTLQREQHDLLVEWGVLEATPPESNIIYTNTNYHQHHNNNHHCKIGSEFDDIDHCSPSSLSDEDGNNRQRLPPEKIKAFLSFLYVVVVTWITAFVMVIVHDRVPDMKKYPPLPDIFLDNVPHIPWAFDMCEVTGTLLFTIWLIVLLFHKHRFILVRRFFSLSGTIFLLRCVTMLITSLSVPGAHLQCKPRNLIQASNAFDNLRVKLAQAYFIWRGAGMSIQGVRTCGDYMFSGHTVALTTLNFFITEYTPRYIYHLQTLSWMMNMFGIFFILAAHEHYSIDVFVAFYITSRLFLYYHTLANNQTLMQRDSIRTRVWFPLFSYFESGVEAIVPNEYDTPAEIAKQFIDFIKDIIFSILKILGYFFQKPDLHRSSNVSIINTNNSRTISENNKKNC